MLTSHSCSFLLVQEDAESESSRAWLKGSRDKPARVSGQGASAAMLWASVSPPAQGVPPGPVSHPVSPILPLPCQCRWLAPVQALSPCGIFLQVLRRAATIHATPAVPPRAGKLFWGQVCKGPLQGVKIVFWVFFFNIFFFFFFATLCSIWDLSLNQGLSPLPLPWSVES